MIHVRTYMYITLHVHVYIHTYIIHTYIHTCGTHIIYIYMKLHYSQNTEDICVEHVRGHRWLLCVESNV
jgi:hypothetical protein